MYRKLLTVLAAVCMATFLGFSPAMAKGAPAGQITNTATVDYEDGDGTTMPQEVATVKVTILPKYGVSVLISPAGLTGYAGSYVSYTVKVTNDGNTSDSFTLSDVHNGVTSTFTPGSMTFYSDASLNPGSQITSVGPLAADAFTQVYMKVAIPGGTVVGKLSNDAAKAVSGGDISVNGSSTDATTTVIAPPLTITKVVSKNNPTPNEIVTYTISVKNNGVVNATTVVITDNVGSVLGLSTMVPGSIKLNGAVQADGLLSGNTLTVPVGTLGANVTATIEFSVKINKPANHAQAVSLSGANASNFAEVVADSLSALDSAPVAITVYSPVLNTSKAANPTSAKPGDTVTFTITAQNSGNDAAKNVVIKDDLTGLPFTYKAGSLKLNGAPQADPAGSLISISVSSIAVNATATVTFDVTVN